MDKNLNNRNKIKANQVNNKIFQSSRKRIHGRLKAGLRNQIKK